VLSSYHITIRPLLCASVDSPLLRQQTMKHRYR